MKRHNIIELCLIVLVVIITWIFARRLPVRISLGEIILGVAVLIFVQSLLRDLWIRYGSNRKKAKDGSQRFQCMCVESTLGVAILIIGVTIAFAGLGLPMEPIPLFWPILIGTICFADFLIKDFVIDWKSGRIRRDPDHANIIFW